MSIKEIRSLTGLSMRAFAMKYNIPYRTMQNWEEGVSMCPDYVRELLEFKVKEEMLSQDDEENEMTKEEMQKYLNQQAREGKNEMEAYRNLMEVLGIEFPIS